jgi:hypothetical protein
LKAQFQIGVPAAGVAAPPGPHLVSPMGTESLSYESCSYLEAIPMTKDGRFRRLFGWRLTIGQRILGAVSPVENPTKRS